MVEPGKGTAATPPPVPQEPETTDGSAAATDPAPREGEPAAMAEPSKETTTTPTSAAPETLTTTGDVALASEPEPSQPKEESVRRPQSQELPDATVAGQPQHTTTTTTTTTEAADGQPPPMPSPTKAGEVAESPPPAETPALPAPTPQQAPLKQEEKTARGRWRRLQDVCFRRGGQSSQAPEKKEGGETKPSAPEGMQPASALEEKKQHAMDSAGGLSAEPAPEQASSVQEKDAAQARAQEGEEKTAPRRWRLLRAVVLLLFLRPKAKRAPGPGPGSGDQSTPLLEDNKGGETKLPKDPIAAGAPPPPPSAKPAVERDEGEKKSSVSDDGRKKKKKKPSRRDEDETQAAPGGKGKTKILRRQESQAGGGAEDEGLAAAGETAQQINAGSDPVKRLQKVYRLLQRIMSWYNRHRASGKDETTPAAAATKDGGGGSETSRMDGDKGKEPEPEPEPEEWAQAEKDLERILEEAFTKHLATEYKQLGGTARKCLLTFSVFELDSKVKKQAMIYWWVAEFELRLRSSPQDSSRPPEQRTSRTMWRRVLATFDGHQGARNKKTAAPAGGGSDSAVQQQQQQGKASKADSDDAQDVFSKLSDDGFLVPIKNWCTKAIHGCKVNPLVHWMVKRQARCDHFADLDAKGSPAADLESKPISNILCLTAGNRDVLQKMHVMGDESQVAENPKAPSQQDAAKAKEVPTKDDSTAGSKYKATDRPSSQQDLAEAQQQDPTEAKEPTKGEPQSISEEPKFSELIALFKDKRVILNVNAHVYPVSSSIFLPLAECLVVLQLGRWRSQDDDTYMEVVGGLESLGSLRNLRYLGLRGLSRLTELPKGIESLEKLAILDMRGCQNLVTVDGWIFSQLKQLTHLDLAECYMLEHIGVGITSLSALQVFKGFVFPAETQRRNKPWNKWDPNKACQLQDLCKFSMLQKLSISVTTDAVVGTDDMAKLELITGLRKLTITWSEIPPSILDDKSEVMTAKRNNHLDKWTKFVLPEGLVKLDLRCYPRDVLQLKVLPKNLQKLYLRGGDLEKFSVNESNSIRTLRLRYLKKFNMEWEKILDMLKQIEHVEVVVKKDDGKLPDDNNKKGAMEDWKLDSLKIPPFTLDEHGVWMKDKVSNNKMAKEGQGEVTSASGPTEDSTGTKDSSAIMSDGKKGDNNDVSKEQGVGKEERAATPEAMPGQSKTDPTTTV